MTDSCEDGVCEPGGLNESSNAEDLSANERIIYVGDPMCSWCWGIANDLSELKKHFATQGIGFDIVVGGLRPGGGDTWDDKMKDFLRHHWEQVNARSGQPFGYKLLDLPEFNYDTEPSCRSVVAARKFIDNTDLLGFFEAVQRKFYVESEDPKEEVFYQDICASFDIPYDTFLEVFRSDEAKRNTHQEFMLNRQWGVRGYPTMVLQREDQLYLVTNGYATFDVLRDRIEQLLSSPAENSVERA